MAGACGVHIAMNPAEKHPAYRTFGSASFAEADEELRRYWRSRTPAERLEALEDLRIAIYGEEVINAKVQRVFGVPESCRH